MLEIWGAQLPWPPVYANGCKEKERTVFSLLDVQASTDRKLANMLDTAELLMKSNIVSIGCYV